MSAIPAVAGRVRFSILLKEPTTDDDRKEAIVCLKKLAVLAGTEQVKAIGHLLDAASIAVQMKDRLGADALYEDAKKRGAEEKKLAALRKQIDALPKPS